MASWIRKFLSTLYVSAVIKDNQCYTYARAIKNGKIIKNLEAVFDCTDGRVDIKFNEYLKKRESEYHSVYLSVLLNSPKQWAIPAVSKQDFSKFAIQYNSVDIVAVDNNWSIVVPKGEIAAFDSSLNRADADLIYSPFSILYESILRNMIKDKLILYIYNIEDSMTMMIFQNKEMRFSAYFDTRKDSSHLVDEKELSKEDTTDIDNVIEKEEDKLNELDGLDDLDLQTATIHLLFFKLYFTPLPPQLPLKKKISHIRQLNALLLMETVSGPKFQLNPPHNLRFHPLTKAFSP